MPIRPLAAALLAAVAAPVLSAPVFNVNSTADLPDDGTMPGICHTTAGTCTLRAAIMQANRSSGIGVAITIPAGTYTLVIPASGADDERSGDLNFTGATPVKVIGAGRGKTIIDANQIDDAVNVSQGANVTLTSMAVTNGFAIAGGAIENQGNLTLTDSEVTGSQATRGGCLYNGYGGVVTMRGGSVAGCSASVGGGIYSTGGELDISGVTIAGNSAAKGGGVVLHRQDGIGSVVRGRALIKNSVISGNSALDQGSGYGGGIILPSDSTLVNVTVAANQALLGGGGVFLDREFGGSYVPIRFFNVTVSENGGGGLRVDPFSHAPFDVYNSLIAGNTEVSDPLPDECAGHVTSHARNVFGDLVGCDVTVADGSVTLLNSVGLLGGLTNNGGPTQTVALLPGNNAIDVNTGNCIDENGQLLTSDQRGFPRPFGAGCDAGAYEFSDVIFRNGFQ